MWKWEVLPLINKKSMYNMLGSSFSSQLDWGSYIASISKTVSGKTLEFLSLDVTLYIYKSTIQPRMEYYHHV